MDKMNLRNKLLSGVTAAVLASSSLNSDALDRTKLEEQLKKYEGYSQKMYFDSLGIPTIGIGFNLSEKNASNRLYQVGANYTKIMSKEQNLNDSQVRYLFNEDVNCAEKSARKLIKSYNSQPEIVQRIVCDMLFNMGESRFGGFKKTIAAIEKRNYILASEEMKDSKWYGQVGNRSKYLVEQMRKAGD